MAIVLKDSTIKYIIKVFLIFVLVLILGLVSIISIFLSDKEINYQESSSKKIEVTDNE